MSATDRRMVPKLFAKEINIRPASVNPMPIARERGCDAYQYMLLQVVVEYLQSIGE